jgi:hypothetical protein
VSSEAGSQAPDQPGRIGGADIATQFCQSYEDPLHRGLPVGNTNCHELLPSGAIAIPLQKEKSPAMRTGLFLLCPS